MASTPAGAPPFEAEWILPAERDQILQSVPIDDRINAQNPSTKAAGETQEP